MCIRDRASLRMVYNEQIMTPRQLYDWAKANIDISFLYSTKDEHEAEEPVSYTHLDVYKRQASCLSLVEYKKLMLSILALAQS